MKNNKFVVAFVAIITIVLLGYSANAYASSASNRTQKETTQQVMQNQIDSIQNKLDQKNRDYTVLQQETWKLQGERNGVKLMQKETEKMMVEIQTFADKCFKNPECKSAVEKFGPKFD